MTSLRSLTPEELTAELLRVKRTLASYRREGKPDPTELAKAENRLSLCTSLRKAFRRTARFEAPGAASRGGHQ